MTNTPCNRTSAFGCHSYRKCARWSTLLVAILFLPAVGFRARKITRVIVEGCAPQCEDPSGDGFQQWSLARQSAWFCTAQHRTYKLCRQVYLAFPSLERATGVPKVAAPVRTLTTQFYGIGVLTGLLQAMP